MLVNETTMWRVRLLLSTRKENKENIKMNKNKKLMRLIAGTLCGCIVTGGIVGGMLSTKSKGVAEDVFVPVFRFAVCSDTHVTPANPILPQKFEKFFDTAYAYADNHESYKDLDAIAVTGDLTHCNTATEMSTVRQIVTSKLRRDTAFLSIMGNHDLYDSATGQDLGTNDNTSYTTIMYEEMDRHLVVDGFHLIGVSNETSMGDYSDSSFDWLEQELAKAATESPDKPIFTFQHFHLTDTVFSSVAATSNSFHSTKDSAQFDALYSKYPQVVNFSGHSHSPGTNTRGVYQKDYTVIDVPAFFSVGGIGYGDRIVSDKYFGENSSFYYSDGTTATGDKVAQSDNGANMYRIVEVDANNRVRIYTYDMLLNGLCKTASSEDGDAVMCFEIENVKDKNTFAYTDEKYADITAPFWSEGASVNLSISSSKATITFPQAREDNCMLGYQVSVTGEDYSVVYNVMDDFYLQENVADETFRFALPTTVGTYTVAVTATNVWGLKSAAITNSFVIE